MKMQFRFLGAFVGALLCLSPVLFSQKQEIVWSHQEKPIVEQLRNIRNLPDETRVRVTKDLALQIRELPLVPKQFAVSGVARRPRDRR